MGLTAHELYPIRIRLVKVVGKVTWVTVAYIPIVRTLQERAASERGSQRRSGVLQRVLYLTFCIAIAASHIGVSINLNGVTVPHFPRILLHLCDQLEEREVLCLRAGSCFNPCSNCDVKALHMSSPVALAAQDRDVVASLERQFEAYSLCNNTRLRRRRLFLQNIDSSTGFVPALVRMAGLSTAPYLLYPMVGFDFLHVRSCAEFNACPSLYHLDALCCCKTGL